MKRCCLIGALGILAVLVAVGCGGGTRKARPSAGSDLFPDYTGPTGSLVLHIIWPVTGNREIPPETRLIDVEVTGEGMPQPRRLSVDRPANQPQSTARIDNLPVGQKGISATARAQAGGPALAFGFASTVVEPNAVKDVVITLTRVEQGGAAAARALVQELRDSGITLVETVATELIDETLVWSADLIPTYALAMQRLDFLTMILTEEHEAQTGAPEEEFESLTSLPAGRYRAELREPTGPWWWIRLRRIGDTAPNTWVVEFPEGDALLRGMVLTFRLVPRDNNLEANEGSFEVVSAIEPQLRYQGSVSVQQDAQKRVTQITVAGSFRDKFLPIPITVTGTASGTPAGAPEQKRYSSLTFTGKIESSKLVLEISQATAQFATPPAGEVEDWSNFITRAQITNLRYEERGVAKPKKFTGNLTAEFQIDRQTATKGPLVKSGSFTGGYESLNLAFSGEISFNWENPQREPIRQIPRGTATVRGRWAVPNRPIFNVSLRMTSASPPTFTVDIDISRGDRFLRGPLTGTWVLPEPGHLKVDNWTLRLTNEAGLIVESSRSQLETAVKGFIKARDGVTELARVEHDPDLGVVLVKYNDGTIESLFPTDTSFSPHPLTGTVRGRVVDATTNNPVPGAWVWSGLEGAITDRQGFFEVRALAGRQTLSIDHPNYRLRQVEVTVPVRGTVDAGTIPLQPR
ncbi:MAG: carboxypeptidase-like regulatory domain-containing protein [Armatimonadetes bacterium]|nr:carboxypeptidase-like regulatory domain-containing protein [Armatimonadota bacterium]MDW8121300.1 hypothetical protein [Armatimonadota bacterium]